ncbi:MAG: Stp1/IreP family PP2C-type Ser/Thr phosphatase [Gemmatimonadota bacterium]
MQRFGWTCAGLSDVGRVRETNEDSMYADEAAGVFVVADGMGGHAAGEVASAIAAERIGALLCRECDAATVEEARAAFLAAFDAAGKEIAAEAARHAERWGMGTTATVLFLDARGDYLIGQIGDSRAYVYRAGELHQLTRDHSWVQEQVDLGVLTPEQARLHPQSNLITRALGVDRDVSPDLYAGELRDGDVFLLASDGLSDMLAPTAIEEALARPGTLEATARSLVDEANRAGGSDNVSVLLVAVSREQAGA